MIAIVEYGVGNLFSLTASLAHIGQACEVTGDPARLMAAERVILPGVGAFEDAIRRLRESGLAPVLDEIARRGTPLLGICLGMQLLFEKSLERGEWAGLGYLPGTVSPLLCDIPQALRVPQIGWNPLIARRPDEPLLKYHRAGDCVYYVHSFYAKGCADAVAAESEYGVMVPGIVRKGNVCGTQFHPEKSGDAGLAMLRAFAEGGAV